MTQQPPAIRLSLPVHGPGQHIATLLLPSSAGALYVSDRLWVRRHAESGRFGLYVAEYWGEASPSRATLSPGPDVPFLLDQDVGALLAGDRRISVNGQTLDYGAESVRQTQHAIETLTFVDSQDYGGSLRLFVHARHPVLYGSLSIKAKRGDMPPLTPISMTAQFPSSVPIHQSQPLMDCRCRFDFGARTSVTSTDPEHTHAYANAGVTVLSGYGVPIES